MSLNLAKSAASVQEVLDKLNLECKVLELPSSARTAMDAASSIGCDVGQIVKSLIFKTSKANRPVLILASGSNQVDIEIIAAFVGESIIKADAVFVREVTGFAIGGVPPLGHKQVIDFIYIDKDLLAFEAVWAAAGTPNAVFFVRSQDLLKVTGAKILSLSKR